MERDQGKKLCPGGAAEDEVNYCDYKSKTMRRRCAVETMRDVILIFCNFQATTNFGKRNPHHAVLMQGTMVEMKL